MTTLPQSPGNIIPRPVGAPAPTAVAGSNAALTGSDVVRVLRSNIWLILALGVISAVGGFLLNMYLAKNYSRFTAYGTLEVVQSPVATLQARTYAMADTMLNVEQRTQVQQLKTDYLMQTVLQDPDSPIRATAWFKSFPDSRERRLDLMKYLTVTPVPDTRLIQVAFTNSNPADAKSIVESVVAQHLREQQKSKLDNTFELKRLYQARREEVEINLRQATADREDAQRELVRYGTGPDGTLRLPIRETELDDTAKKLAEAATEAQKWDSAATRFKQQVESGQEPVEISRLVETDQEFLRAQSLARDVELSFDEAKRTYKEDSKQYKMAADRVTEYNASRDRIRQQLVTKYREQVAQDFESRKAAAVASLQSLQEKSGKLRNEQAEIDKVRSRYQSAALQESTQAKLLEDVKASIDDVNSGGSDRAEVRWSTRPIEPDSPSFPKLEMTLGLSVVVGLGLALAIAFARELLDTTIRSPRDIAKTGNIAVLGTIPHEDDDPQAAGSRLVIAEAPGSMTAENLRQLRTRLQHQGNLDVTRSLLVTSPNPGDGKTTVAANVAAGMALAGRKVLLVDANFRRPELHKLFSVEGKDGFANALTAPDSLATLAKSTKVPNLSVLPAGSKPGNATELLESSLFSTFIEKALENYDNVVFDSGPLLFASETVAMAPKVDGVVTVVRARQSTRGVLARVKDNLRQTKANSLGVIINGIRAYGGGYYSRNIRTYYEYSGNSR